MTYVRSLTDARPPIRYDGIPYVEATIEETPDLDGSPDAANWTDLEAFDLVPDADPAAPAYRDLTTDLGVLESGWLRVVWLDTEGASAVSGAVAFDNAATPVGVRERIGRMVNADSYPELDDSDLDELLRLAQRPDTDGVIPSDSTWVPTYNLNAAAATGWEWKAAKASGDFRFSEDGQSFSREQVFEHCMRMARLYSSGAGGSVTVGSIVGRNA